MSEGRLTELNRTVPFCNARKRKRRGKEKGKEGKENVGGGVCSFSSPQCVTRGYSRAQFSDPDSFLATLIPKRILSKLMILNTLYTLKTLKYLCPDWTSPPSSKVKHPAAYSTPPLGCLIDIFNFTRMTPSTCPSLRLLPLSK